MVWVGSNTAIQIFVIRALRAGPDRTMYFAGEVEWYGTRVRLPTALTLVILGFILLHESSRAYDLGQGWVLRRLRRIFLVSRIELLLLILAVLYMTIKPGLS